MRKILTPAMLLQLATMTAGLAAGWGTLQATTSAQATRLDRIDRQGTQALQEHKQIDQDRYTDLVRRLDVLTVEQRNTAAEVRRLVDSLDRDRHERRENSE